MNKPSEAEQITGAYPPAGDVLQVTRHSVIRMWEGNRILKQRFREEEGWRIEREYHALRHGLACGLPVPTPIAYIEHGDRPGLICEWLTGPTMRAYLVRRLWSLNGVARSYATLHAQIHSAPFDGMPRADDDYRDGVAAAELSPEARNNVLDMLDRLPAETTLCHGDFHLENVLWSGSRWYVVDWERAHAGFPLLDVAKTALLLHLESRARGGMLWYINYALRHVFLRAYLRQYGALTGRSRATWEDHLTVAAAIMAGSLRAPERRSMYARYVEARLCHG